MSDALLQSIFEDPDDVATRRVYADALSTTGDPRGEFIQIQCDLAADPQQPELRRRERALLTKHGKTWTAPFAKVVFSPKFERGMIASAFVNAKQFARAPGALLDREPVVSLGMRALTHADAATLGARPDLGRLRSLRVTESALVTRGTRALFSAHLTRLRDLDLYQAGVDDEGLAHLRTTVFAQLERLVLSGNRLSPDAVDALLHEPRLARLGSLALQWLAPAHDGARRVATHLDLPALTALDLASNHYRNPDIAVLARNRSFAGLRTLRLEQNELAGAAPIEALAPLVALEDLDLSTNAIGPDGAAALAGSRVPLRRLDLMQGQLGEDGVRNLATARFPLEVLDLRYCGVGPR
nr:TIGR02996 domain-containing protein [Deltaproteobacteria bacterium]